MKIIFELGDVFLIFLMVNDNVLIVNFLLCILFVF